MAAPFDFFKKYWSALVIGLIGIGLAIALPLLGVFAPFVGLGVLGIAAANGILLGITLVAVALVALTIWGVSKYKENRAAKDTEPKATPIQTPHLANQNQATKVANFIQNNLFLDLDKKSTKLRELGKITTDPDNSIVFRVDSTIASKIADNDINALVTQINQNYGANATLRGPSLGKGFVILSKDVAHMAPQIPTDTIVIAPPTTTATTTATTTTALPATATTTTGGTAPTITTTTTKLATKEQATQVANFIQNNLVLQNVGVKTTPTQLGDLGETVIGNDNAVTFTLRQNLVHIIPDNAMKNLIKEINTKYDLTIPNSHSTLTISSSDVAKMASKITSDTLVTPPLTATATITTTTTPESNRAKLAEANQSPLAPPPTTPAPVIASQDDAQRVLDHIKSLAVKGGELGDIHATISLLAVTQVPGTANYQITFKEPKQYGPYDPTVDEGRQYYDSHPMDMDAHCPDSIKRIKATINNKWPDTTSIVSNFIAGIPVYYYEYNISIPPQKIQEILPTTPKAPTLGQ